MILSGKALNYIFHELDIRSSLSSWKGCLTFQPGFFNPKVQPQGSTPIFNPGLSNHELFNPINYLGLKSSWLSRMSFNYLSMNFSTMNILSPDFSTLDFSTMNFSTINFSTMNFSTMNFSTMNFLTMIFSTMNFSKCRLDGAENPDVFLIF